MNFLFAFKIIFPLFVYIGVGILAKKTGRLESKTALQVNKFAFHYLLSLLMFRNVIAAGEVLNVENLKAASVFVIVVFVWFFIVYFFTPLVTKDKPRQGSFIQASFRGNSVLFALPLAQSLCGTEAAGLASIAVALVVPMYNILAVCELEIKRGTSIDVWRLVRSVFKNPMIQGAVVGIVFVVFKLELPEIISVPVEKMANTATPISLIMLGAQISFGGILKDIRQLLLVCLIKLVLIPGTLVLVTKLLGYPAMYIAVGLALGAVPTAVASHAMAQNMGADGDFAGEAVATTTAFSMLTLFLWISILKGTGII